MGNRSPHVMCTRCLRWFFSSEALFRHQQVKGHLTKRMEQSRYIRVKTSKTEKQMSVAKPKYTTSIALVPSNYSLPDMLLRKLVSENPTACGFVVREPDKLVVEKFPHIDGVEKNLKFLETFFKNTTKFTKMVCFHDFKGEFDEDETQPFTLLVDSKKNPVLVVAIEGDFPTQTSKEGFSEAYVLFNEWLKPKIEQMYALMGNSVNKVVDYMKTAQFANDFALVTSHRGVLTVMPPVGEAFVLTKYAEGAEHLELEGDWGEVSNAYGLTASALEAATAVKVEPKEEPKPVTKASKYADEDPAPKPDVVVPLDPKPAEGPIEKVAENMQETKIAWTPPKNLHGKALKASYRSVNDGVLPEDWDQRPMIMITAQKNVSSLKDLDKTSAAVVKDMKPAAAAPAKLSDTLPVIDGIKQKAAVDFIKKYLGDGSAAVDEHPLETQKRESKLAVFSQLVMKSGKLDEIYKWPTAFFFAFAKEHHEAAALGLIEMRSRIRQLEEQLKIGDKTLGELTGSAIATPAPVDSPAVTAPKEEPKVEEPPVKISKYA